MPNKETSDESRYTDIGKARRNELEELGIVDFPYSDFELGKKFEIWFENTKNRRIKEIPDISVGKVRRAELKALGIFAIELNDLQLGRMTSAWYENKKKGLYKYEDPNGIKAVTSNAVDEIKKCEEDVFYRIDYFGQNDLVEKFVKKYPISTTKVYKENEQQLLNILQSSGVNITRLELSNVLRQTRSEFKYNQFKNAIVSSDANTVENIIRIYLDYFGENYSIHVNLLIRFLKENNNYSGNIENDISSVQKLLQREKFLMELDIDDKEAITIEDIDSMPDGYIFEEFLVILFKNMGFTAIKTPLSQDKGADLILKKFNENYVVQAKKYSQSVPFSAIQEAHTAKDIYNANRAIVVTNNYFTPQAMKCAKKLDVNLWDREKMKDLLKNYPTIFKY